MIKSEKQIEEDFYHLVMNSPLKDSINGKVYHGEETRPADSQKEDCVVKFLSGIDRQVQSGIIVLNIYVPDKQQVGTGKLLEDSPRVKELEELIIAFIENNANTEYWIRSEHSPKSREVKGRDEHCVIARIYFQRITN